MEVRVYEGKTKEEIIENINNELNLEEKDYVYTVETTKGSLLKKSMTKMNVYLLTDLAEYSKSILDDILQKMGIETKYETKIRDNQIEIKMFSDNNSLLIGSEGRTLKSLNLILRQAIANEINVYPNIYLDVENYKEKQQKRLERLANNLAKDVIRTKIEIKMDNMNAFERRIVHNALSTNSKVTTVSEGVEPNRHVIIKLKED